MMSGARRRRSLPSPQAKRSELFEITAIAHRYDDALGRNHQPASILSLDLFDRTEAGQWRARHDLINVAVSLHVDETVTSCGLSSRARLTDVATALQRRQARTARPEAVRLVLPVMPAA